MAAADVEAVSLEAVVAAAAVAAVGAAAVAGESAGYGRHSVGSTPAGVSPHLRLR
jgi:hypothetical protein